MKKSLVLILALALVLSFTACGDSGADSKDKNTGTESNTESDHTDPAAEPASDEESNPVDSATEPGSDSENPSVEPDSDAKSEGVMTYAEYDAAALDSEVTIEAYVQAHQSWWDNKITVYAQDKDGAYFLYNMTCSEEDSAKLTPGTKIRVKGYKTEWAGEVEIGEGATFEILEGSYIAAATDVTSLLGTDDLIKHQNELVAFKGMTVESYTKDGEDYNLPFVYKDNNSGDHDSNSDLYFNVSLNGQTYTFCVESYLCDNTTDVYAAVENLKVGDVVDLEGFLYWYNGANPHITSVTVK